MRQNRVRRRCSDATDLEVTLGNSERELDTARLAGVVDALADVVVVIGTDGIIRWANRAAADLVDGDLDSWTGRSGFELVHPDDLALAAASLETVQTKAAGTPIEVRIKSSDGWRLTELLGSRLDDDHLVLVLRDLTERRRWEVAGDDVARFRSIVHNAAGLTLLLSAEGSVMSCSASLTRCLGHDPEAVCGNPFADLVTDEDRPVFDRALAEAIGREDLGGVSATVEVNLRSRLGVEVPFELSLVCLLDDPTVQGVVVSGHDITRLRIAQDALAELAHYDSLTGLLNRRSFDDALEREWMLSQRDGIDTFVVVADLDGFKAINDRFGHSAGDDALRQVARALHACVRTTDVLGRLGGDEFGGLLVRCGGEAAAIGFVARLQEEMARRPWPFDATVGVTCAYQSLKRATSPTEALHTADLAMLAKKRDR
jgi:diguanylate cyclase (GGDEF)-like protein/PAS domain S-box-containing protein